MNFLKLSRSFLFISALFVAIVTPSALFPFVVGKYAWFRGMVSLALLFFALALLFQDRGRELWMRFVGVFRKPLVIAVFLFTSLFLLAGLLGVNSVMSFWSNFERGEGALQMLYLFAFFALLLSLFREERDWRAFFWWVIAGGVFSITYGFLAAWNVPGFIGARFSEAGFRFQASIGNPAYVAAVVMFMLFYIGYLLWSKYRARLQSTGAWVLWALLMLFAVVFALAATRGAFIGLLAGLLAGAGYFVFVHRAWRRWFAAGALALVLLVGTLVFLKDVPFVKAISGSRIFDLSFTAQTFEHRTIMWGIALEGWRERPLLGWGPENYLQVFDRKFDPSYFKPAEGFGAWFDRAHSIYFDYLVEAGALGLLSFLGIFAVLGWQLFRRAGGKEEENIRTTFPRALIVGVVVAYLTQGIVLFNALPISYNLFVVLAFAVYLFAPAMTPNRSRARLPPAYRSGRDGQELLDGAVWKPRAAAVVMAIMSIGGIIWGAYAPLAKAREYPRALRNIVHARNAEEFKARIDPLLAMRFPIGREEVVGFLTAAIADIIAAGSQSEEGARWLATYIEPYLSPGNVRHLLAGGDLYYTLWKQYGRRDEYYDRAGGYYTAARTIAPKLPSALYALFDLAVESGEAEKAREVGEGILRLWPSDERVRRALQ